MKTSWNYLRWALWTLTILPIFTGFSNTLESLPNSLSNEEISLQTSFNQEVQRFDQFVQETFGVKIHFSKDWESNRPRFSADAMTLSGKVVRVSGYDFRSNSLGAFRLGLCHEVGHYLGGFPYLQIDPTSVDSTLNRLELSAEGQADYFSTYCLKKYFDHTSFDHSSKDEWSFDSPQSEAIANFCANQSKCIAIATAALDLVNYLDHLSNQDQASSTILFDSYQDTQPSTRTLNQRREYPDLRCRLRTFLSGIICENENLPREQFVCASGKGARPDCWFSQPEIPPQK